MALMALSFIGDDLCPSSCPREMAVHAQGIV